MTNVFFLMMVACGGTPNNRVESEAPSDPVRDAVYFVLVDRYANGDPSNDRMVQPDDPSGWHGGDIAGIRAHVDDIADLGVGAVWISPISATRTEPFDGWGAFHGYWTHDLGEIEPRFGTFGEARALADALHERDLRLLLDMVYNHVGYDAPRTTSHPHWFHARGDIVD